MHNYLRKIKSEDNLLALFVNFSNNIIYSFENNTRAHLFLLGKWKN